ncbi:MAG: biotin/lipoyl-containing protein, partial [Deltaproteobacteria bacterium]|nr:biotin/lipoyl-containing protein [Deltaproteobacteria bacterium]
MADVRMPKLSDNMESGVIIRWMKSPGDAVAKGEPLAEVETDKADVELEASESGVLREITVAEGQSAPVGAVIAVLGTGDAAAPAQTGQQTPRPQASAQPRAEPEGDGEDAKPAEPAPAPRRAAPPAAAAKPPAAKPAGARPVGAMPAVAPRPAAAKPAARAVDNDAQSAVRASPLAWRLAEESGVDLTAVRGSGPGGRILQRDVE